jgi:hypothetical protein
MPRRINGQGILAQVTGSGQHGLAGYLLERTADPPWRSRARAWGCLVVMAMRWEEPPGRARLRPVGRLVQVAATDRAPVLARGKPALELAGRSVAGTLRPVRNGAAYRLTSAPERGLVVSPLAQALESVFERFARARGFTPDRPLEIVLTRGFKAGSHGHGEGRATDIGAVGGKSLLVWKREWDRGVATAGAAADPPQRAKAIAAEQGRNLGYALYKTLQAHGGWRVNPKGWHVYRGVIQLFGPWTAAEGPWKQMHLKNPTAFQRKRLADQKWVFRAHQDHIHVAR